MNLEALKKYCLAMPGTSKAFPFDQETIVFKVGSKMFALANIFDDPLRVNLKCDPILAMDLRERYDSVLPGYHMNKLHWNTVVMDNSVPAEEIEEMIDFSYKLVFKGLKKTEKERIESLLKPT